MSSSEKLETRYQDALGSREKKSRGRNPIKILLFVRIVSDSCDRSVILSRNFVQLREYKAGIAQSGKRDFT